MIDPLSYRTESFHLLTWQVTNMVQPAKAQKEGAFECFPLVWKSKINL